MSTEPVATPAFTMIGSDTAAACEGDACAVFVEPATDTVAEAPD